MHCITMPLLEAILGDLYVYIVIESPRIDLIKSNRLIARIVGVMVSLDP